MPDLAARSRIQRVAFIGRGTYMMPSTTTGVSCNSPVLGTVNIHLGPSRLILLLSICVSVV
jgi:hypothetical protein